MKLHQNTVLSNFFKSVKPCVIILHTTYFNCKLVEFACLLLARAGVCVCVCVCVCLTHQSTGLYACCSRYGDFSLASRLAVRGGEGVGLVDPGPLLPDAIVLHSKQPDN